ncbi:amino acid permease [Mycolicibacterium duvalii]|uniref:Amino acid permease n=1 Tax=Mycolicibacterium duvalii TaxID=39688 RepID=A0A7I7K7D0_9MYCO|nr:APC family permease [Mycolicibacterium duvalii]MCV7366039.1 APC family permease [Mycolicibacterium duvalii]PEG40119.1 amino acid permease [Mycolicibacterium duvalii]BBX19484.1 amino acid permease [Mycolicibacterium duvalii]
MGDSKVDRTEEASLLKVLGNWDVLALGFGAMIGFGWVVLTGGWIDSAGTFGAALAMIVGGAIMAVVGLTYAELTAAMPRAGGEHHFLLRGMGPRWSFVGSWGIIGGYVTIVAFEAVALPRTALYLFPDLNQIRLWEVAGSEVYLTWALVGAIAAVVITTINILGVKFASVAQTFVVVLLLVIALMLVVGSFTGGSTDNMEPFFTGGAAGFVAVLVVVPFLFVGFDVIPQSAEEVNVPARQIGRLVVIAVILATIFYVVTIVTTSSAMPVGELAAADIATADAFGALFNSDLMAKVLIAGGIAGILTSWNSLLLGASRLMYSLARSGMLPAWFATLHPRFRTPVNALLFIGALSFLAPFLGEAMLGWLVDSGSPSIVIAYLLVSIVFVILRRREPQMDRPLRVGGSGNAGIAIGVAAVVLCVGLLSLYLPGMPAFLDPQPWLLFGAWWLLGAFFLLRIPTGVEPGHDAEERLRHALVQRRTGAPSVGRSEE